MGNVGKGQATSQGDVKVEVRGSETHYNLRERSLFETYSAMTLFTFEVFSLLRTEVQIILPVR